MEPVRRQDFGRVEPVRMFFLAFSWSLGPFLGVYLRNPIDPTAPFLVGTLVIILLGGFFLYRSLSESPAITRKRAPITNPFHYLPRFFPSRG